MVSKTKLDAAKDEQSLKTTGVEESLGNGTGTALSCEDLEEEEDPEGAHVQLPLCD